MSATIRALPIQPVVKTVIVQCSPAMAFDIFTAEIGTWYPIDSFSVKPAIDCRFEPYVGGRLYEIAVDGQETLWGRVLEWNPPHALAIAWQARCSEEESQRIDISFRAVADGTEVHLVHAGWERLKIDGALWREKYDGGWVEIFERCFKAYADKAA